MGSCWNYNVIHRQKKDLSRCITNPQNDLCAQRRLRSAWAKDPMILHADSEDSDQSGRMPRLIRVFAGRTCHFVGFVVRKLNLNKNGSRHLRNRKTCQRSCITKSFLRVQLQKGQMSRDMTKPIKWLCDQRRLRSVWASAQSDQSLRCPHAERLGP